MRIHIQEAVNAEDLRRELAAIDTSVPARTDGRTTLQTETRTICRLLSTLDAEDSLTFPVSLHHGDRPDFTLTEASNRAGIEATEAVPKQYAAYCALAEREFPNALLEPSHFRLGAPELTVEQMRDLLRQDQLSGEPWVGDKPEREWATWMKSVVDVKLEKMKKDGYRLYPSNRLLIYDNLPLPHIDLTKAIDFLTPMLESVWSQDKSFDSIYVEHGQFIIEFTAESVKSMAIRDLW